MHEPKLLTVAGKNALGEYDRLRGQFPATGLYPILLGDSEDYERIRSGLDRRPDPAIALNESKTVEPSQWLRGGVEADPELYECDEGEWSEANRDELRIVTHLDTLSHKPKHEVLIALLSVAAPWEAFAHLNWGGWNECPFPAEHCAMHRYWEAKWGAEVMSITADVVQCVVSRPPADREACMSLAREQYVYCNDIVDQGVGTIAVLGASLLNSRCWYFWWD